MARKSSAQLTSTINGSLPSGTGNPSTGAGVKAADHRAVLGDIRDSFVNYTDGIAFGTLLLFKGPDNTAAEPETNDIAKGWRTVGSFHIYGTWIYDANEAAWLELENLHQIEA